MKCSEERAKIVVDAELALSCFHFSFSPSFTMSMLVILKLTILSAKVLTVEGIHMLGRKIVSKLNPRVFFFMGLSFHLFVVCFVLIYADMTWRMDVLFSSFMLNMKSKF